MIKKCRSVVAWGIRGRTESPHISRNPHPKMFPVSYRMLRLESDPWCFPERKHSGYLNEYLTKAWIYYKGRQGLLRVVVNSAYLPEKRAGNIGSPPLVNRRKLTVGWTPDWADWVLLTHFLSLLHTLSCSLSFFTPLARKVLTEVEYKAAGQN